MAKVKQANILVTARALWVILGELVSMRSANTWHISGDLEVKVKVAVQVKLTNPVIAMAI